MTSHPNPLLFPNPPPISQLRLSGPRPQVRALWGLRRRDLAERYARVRLPHLRLDANRDQRAGAVDPELPVVVPGRPPRLRVRGLRRGAPDERLLCVRFGHLHLDPAAVPESAAKRIPPLIRGKQQPASFSERNRPSPQPSLLPRVRHARWQNVREKARSLPFCCRSRMMPASKYD